MHLAAVTCALALGGCGTTDGGGGIPSPSDPRVVQIQQQAAAICGWLPAATTVAKILTTFSGGGATVDLVSTAAQGICSAITAKGFKRGAGAPSYRGVRIEARKV